MSLRVGVISSVVHRTTPRACEPREQMASTLAGAPRAWLQCHSFATVDSTLNRLGFDAGFMLVTAPVGVRLVEL